MGIDPLFVGTARRVLRLDLLVLQDPPLLEIHKEDPAGLKPTFSHDSFRSDVENPHFGGHHDKVVVGENPARRAQPVAIEHGADLAAIGERDRGGAVPRFEQKRVVLIKGPALVTHLRVMLPGLGDHHENRLGELTAAQA